MHANTERDIKTYKVKHMHTQTHLLNTLGNDPAEGLKTTD